MDPDYATMDKAFHDIKMKAIQLAEKGQKLGVYVFVQGYAFDEYFSSIKPKSGPVVSMYDDKKSMFVLPINEVDR